MDADILVVGGGIVGLSTAMHISQQFPNLKVMVLEKEKGLAQHQTGHNSGVIHAGVYYAPGSMKARFCKAGVEATISFCKKHNIPYEQCGKLIIATNELENTRLDALYARCLENGLNPEWLDKKQLEEKEPRVTGTKAIFVQSSGITDYVGIANAMADEVRKSGGSILTGQRVINMREEQNQVVVETDQQTFRARYGIVCAGVMADRLAKMCGLELDFRVIPFRGEYYRLPESKNNIVNHLTYPVPNPDLPFLGVHLTKMIGGYTTVGPNAVLALSRNGYSWGDINIKDLIEMAGYSGFWGVMRKNARAGIGEMKNSLFKSGYLEQCRKYCPELTLDDLQPYPSGVRAQAVSPDGTLIHDFLIRHTNRTFHVCNAPSPAATSSIPIGGHIVSEMTKVFEIK